MWLFQEKINHYIKCNFQVCTGGHNIFWTILLISYVLFCFFSFVFWACIYLFPH